MILVSPFQLSIFCDFVILLKPLRVLEPGKIFFPCAEQMLVLILETTIAMAETSLFETDTQIRTSGGMSFIGNNNNLTICSPFYP